MCDFQGKRRLGDKSDNYQRPKKTVQDTLQDDESIAALLEGYEPVAYKHYDELMTKGYLCRYFTYDKKDKIEKFRIGGAITRVTPDYVVLCGARNRSFSVQSYIRDNKNQIIYKTKFFIKPTKKMLEKLKSKEEDKMIEAIFDKQQEEIEELKKNNLALLAKLDKLKN